jgi:ComF family protein
MFLNDFIALFYPDLCLVCGNNLLKHEECICITCLHKTPKTNCFKQKENEVSKIFWGRSKLENAAALFTFNKDGNAQKLIHTLKYEEGKNVGIFLGEQLGFAIKESEFFNNIDIVIAVPLHPKKQKLRGYNQSAYLAKGIKEVLSIPINKKSLLRIENTDSQTRKKRFSRWENMMNSFDLKNSNKLMDKHILLVDDVVTTGATLEACAQKILEIKGVKVSIVTIAVA